MVAFATQVKRRRGTAEQNNEFTGAEGEIVVNLTDKSLRVHDGQTKGGFETLRQNMQNSVNITNCITEIPQDIKLELNNGVLTLKAGSKIYYPNGSGVFEEAVVSTDRTYTDATKTGQWLVCFTRSLAGVVGSVENSVSGTSQPTAGFSLWYNTEENIMYRYGSITSDPTPNVSLPIAIVTLDNTGVASIDQVFNGFGYIGSSRFILPKMRIIYPDGLNDDGTLRNTEYETQGVSVYLFRGPTSVVATVGPQTDNYSPYYEQTQKPTTGGLWYNPQTNLMLRSTDNGATWVQRKSAVCVRLSTDSTGKIINFTPKEVFHAVDYNDTGFIAHQAMPEPSSYVEWTLGATGTNYTAPADGYFVFTKTADAVNQYVAVASGAMREICFCPVSGFRASVMFPCSKGQSINIAYTAGGVTSAFGFVYANGAK